ncbi:MAG: NAD(P)-binding domain-containing protein [Bacteroidales bacterium]|nr:NAD(P)-binding domain-containing protein [Bacteroidales bacterium]MCF8390665.1 NAD(P)-binding domain-containing protein [Bacteroidales bacterium]
MKTKSIPYGELASSVGFIGGGRITKIFLQGFKNQNVRFSSVTVCDSNAETLNKLKNDFPFIETTEKASDAASKELVFIALHPPVIGETITQLKDVIDKNALIISLAPKFSIQKLSELLGTERIGRMIPNATSYANLGYNPVCFSNAIDKLEKDVILETLKVLGNTIETDEKKLEAYAIASAMLPTYFWFQWNEMQNISKEMGLSAEESRETIYETLKASLELMYNKNLSYTEITDLIPVKPIGDSEAEIKEILNKKLLGLFDKIKP